MRKKDRAKQRKKAQQVRVKEKKRLAVLPCTYFGGEGSEELNAMRSALYLAADRRGFIHEYREYELIDKSPESEDHPRLKDIPRTSLTVNLVEALHELGYDIVYTGNHRADLK